MILIVDGQQFSALKFDGQNQIEPIVVWSKMNFFLRIIIYFSYIPKISIVDIVLLGKASCITLSFEIRSFTSTSDQPRREKV
jgi:hypothetical protein